METIKLNLRLPRELHTELVDLAFQQHRSLNQQIVFVLETYITLPKEMKGDPT
jgi:predicted HicB family RNase H-like nuclease